MKILLATEAILSHKADCVVVGLDSKAQKLPAGLAELDRSCHHVLSNWCANKQLRASQSVSMQLVGTPACKALCIIRIQERSDNAACQLHDRLCAAAAAIAAAGWKSLAVHLPSLAVGLDDDGTAVRVAAAALVSSCYRFNLGRQLKNNSLTSAVLVTNAAARSSSRMARVGTAIGYGMRVTRHLAEQPPNQLYPHVLAQYTRKLATDAGLKVKVLERAALDKLKMGGLLAVGQGSVREPRLIVIQHHGGKPKAAPVALVGKGITFDTGGNSIKPGSAMVDMKYDMCGAAGMVGTMLAVAKLRLPLNVVAVIPSAENMLSGKSFRPDDIIRMMDGTSVEVLNTDAEGRLILADALTYVQKFHKPELIIDAATLTGACLVALGQHRSGMCSNDDKLAARLYEAGEASGDLSWRLPLDGAYDRMLESKFADLANIGGGRNAGTITAACFLQRFVKDLPWAHLDIAGTAWQQQRASGRPVPQLVTFLARHAGMAVA